MREKQRKGLNSHKFGAEGERKVAESAKEEILSFSFFLLTVEMFRIGLFGAKGLFVNERIRGREIRDRG